MKVLFIPVNTTIDLNNLKLPFSKLPKSISIASSSQYSNLIPLVAEKLKPIKIEIIGIVTGCSKPKINSECLLLITSGKFHAIQIALATNKPVYILDPEEKKIKKIQESEIEVIKNRRKLALLKFLSSDIIGLIVSIKPGQENLKKAEELKKILEKKGKRVYLFFTETLNFNDLDNFKIQCYINTACEAIVLDRPDIINITEINNYINSNF